MKGEKVSPRPGCPRLGWEWEPLSADNTALRAWVQAARPSSVTLPFFIPVECMCDMWLCHLGGL